ncbi:hypothetical protein AB6A40_006120 [Gnathostoma spinigerum]|uniref:Uncharacterized protein n=1 Tax=Gnathostoma spinigerum TaxID=75299 RepID=A0ABD6EJI3_9BILA
MLASDFVPNSCDIDHLRCVRKHSSDTAAVVNNCGTLPSKPVSSSVQLSVEQSPKPAHIRTHPVVENTCVRTQLPMLACTHILFGCLFRGYTDVDPEVALLFNN